MTRLERTLDGKELPKNVVLYRDENTGALAIGRSESAMVGVRTPSISSVR